jgi:hypothetical protein
MGNGFAWEMFMNISSVLLVVVFSKRGKKNVLYARPGLMRLKF